VRASALFSNGHGRCGGYPASFRDTFVFSTADGVLTTRQLSTGDVDTGPVSPDGSFSIADSAIGESYRGQITGLTATAAYAQRNRSGCVETYQVTFRFLV
jgi:hypothetical protein